MDRAATLLHASLAFTLALGVGCSGSDDSGPTGQSDPSNEPEATDVIASLGDRYVDDFRTRSGSRVAIATEDLREALERASVWDLRNFEDFDRARIAGSTRRELSSLANLLRIWPASDRLLFVSYDGEDAAFAAAIVNVIGTHTGHEAQYLVDGISSVVEPRDVRADGTWEYPQTDEYCRFIETGSVPDEPAGQALPDIGAAPSDTLALLLERGQDALDAWIDGSAKTNPIDVIANDGPYVIHVGDPITFVSAHLPGARPFQLARDSGAGDFASDQRLGSIPADRPTLVYDATGQSSAHVVAYLRMLGFDAKSLPRGARSICSTNATLCPDPWAPAADINEAILEGTAIPSIDPATTPQELMENFLLAWTTQDIDVYDTVLHPDFQFRFSPQDIGADPTLGANWGRAQEIQAAEFIFGEVVPEDPSLVVSDIQQTQFALQRQLEGEEITEDQFAGPPEVQLDYEVSISFILPDRTMTVSGEQSFFMVSESQTIGGLEVDVWQLVGWADRGLSKRKDTENVSWGAFKARY